MWTRRAVTAVSGRVAAMQRVAMAPLGARAVHVEATAASIQNAIKSEDVVVFSKTHCPFCARVKALFEELDVAHEVVELDQRPDGVEIQALLLELTKQRTVPNVFIKNQHIGGCDDVMQLHQSKALAKMLQ